MKTEIKQKIVDAIKENRHLYSTDAQHGRYLGISREIYCEITRGKIERKLSDAQWAMVARKLDLDLTNRPEWKTASTPVYIYITEQLEKCQFHGVSILLCDIADCGKTYTAKQYVKSHKNAIIIDCSQCKSKRALIQALCKEFGVNARGRYTDVFNDLIFYIRAQENPLIILDEAGDLEYPAFLELKALWNATERACGWYMMGADGLKAKINNSIDREKVGYTEILSRFGKRFAKAVPVGKEESEEFLTQQAALVAKANLPEGVKVDLRSLIAKADNSLRRVYIEVQKLCIEMSSDEILNG